MSDSLDKTEDTTPVEEQPVVEQPAPAAEPEVAAAVVPTTDAPSPSDDSHVGVLQLHTIRSIRVPMVGTKGHVLTSFGLTLSGKAAQALADLTAGFALTTGPAHLDHNHALNLLLEGLADA